jgi:hypothetical protein
MSTSRTALRAKPYIVSYSVLTSPHNNDEKTLIQIRESEFIKILRPLIAGIQFDEVWYCRHYPDVELAVQTGAFPTGHDHYLRSGYFESRMPRKIDVDENWYLSTYQDVAEAIRQRNFATGQDHFEVSGFREGRLPSDDWQL